MCRKILAVGDSLTCISDLPLCTDIEQSAKAQFCFADTVNSSCAIAAHRTSVVLEVLTEENL